MKKVFILTQFGIPHEWTQQYIDHVQHLEKFGWYWKIFTPNDFKSKGNVEIIPMTIEELNVLMEKKIGLNPKNYLLPNGLPSKHVSDFYVAAGAIFEDYIKDFDYWGITNWDIVYGRLDSFLKDSHLEGTDIFTDELTSLNGIFSLFKNTPYINNLFREIPGWDRMFVTHQLFGTDEYHMTQVIDKNTKEGKIICRTPQYYPLHSHDRLEQHVPDVKLEMKADGSLYELFRDVAPPNWIHARPIMGKQIAYFHFIRTKKWPL